MKVIEIYLSQDETRVGVWMASPTLPILRNMLRLIGLNIRQILEEERLQPLAGNEPDCHRLVTHWRGETLESEATADLHLFRRIRDEAFE